MRTTLKSFTLPILLFLLFCCPAHPAVAQSDKKPLTWQLHDLPHTKKTHTEIITSNRHEYTIIMAGNVDMDHALTHCYDKFQLAFQPLESIVIENLGPVPARNVKLIINNRGNWYDLDHLLHEFTASAETPQEAVYLIWYHLLTNRHHEDPIFRGRELHDPVKMITIYGGGLCDDSGSIGAALFHAAHCETNPFVRALRGHMMCEVFASGRRQFMDIDEGVFYLDRENELPVGGDEVAADHDLAHREFHFGPQFKGWLSGQESAAFFGCDDGKGKRLEKGYQIKVNLRPSERIEYRWDNIGKWAMAEPQYNRRWVGNSFKYFEPLKTDPLSTAVEYRNIGWNKEREELVLRSNNIARMEFINRDNQLKYNKSEEEQGQEVEETDERMTGQDVKEADERMARQVVEEAGEREGRTSKVDGSRREQSE